jgi:tRNA modification GTPase
VIKTCLIDKSIDDIQNEIIKKVEEKTKEYETTDCIVNERQEEIIKAIYDKIVCGIQQWENKEIVSIYMNEALKEIESLTGKISNQEILNNIFDKFCIGK